MLAKHSFCHNGIVQVFHEDHIASVAKSVSLFEMKVLARVVNGMMRQSNFDSSLLIILRPLGFSTVAKNFSRPISTPIG
jgi:hypothetical protein